MIKYSVKKPYTVLVSVIAIIVFGVISYLRMVPDLLPSIDYPYVVAVTTYPGAAPEEVETTVTKPMEQSFAALNNIKSVSSTSSANYSMVILEFEQDTNMDGAMVDILQAVQQLTGAWDESVGTPTLIKINPNMIPVMVAAVESEDMDRYELCDFAQSTLMSELEGTTGLASVSAGGLVERTVTVTLSDAKIDAYNAKVKDAIEENAKEALEKLEEAQQEIDDAVKQVEDGIGQLSNLNLSGMSTSFNTDDLTAMITAAQQTDAAIDASEAQLSALQAEKELYQSGVDTLRTQISELQGTVDALTLEREILANAISAGSGMDDSTPVSELGLDDTSLGLLTGLALNTLGEVKARDVSDAAQIETLNGSIAAAQTSLADAEAIANVRIPEIDAQITAETQNLADLQAQAQAQADYVAGVQAGLEALPGQLASGLAQISMAGGQLAVAQSGLTQAQTELDAAYETYQDQLAAAVKAADLNKVLSLSTLSSIIGAQNFDMPAGFAHDEAGSDVIVTVGDKLGSLAELENLVLMDMGIDGLEPVHLCDVADIVISDNAGEIYATLNGSDGLVLMFSKQSNFATAAVSDNLQAKFRALEEKYPGLHFSSLMDQGDYIYLIRDSIISSLLWGAAFSVLVLFLFLQDWRPTVITLLSIPVSLLLTYTMMYFAGVTVNIMSMSGLAVSVGMLVDNSVVVIENTYRLRNLGESTVKSAVSGAKQVAGAVAASTLTTVCVFAPIVFLNGLTKELFTDMVLTLSFALLASLLVSVTVVPALAGTLLKNAKPSPEGAFSRFMPKYRNAVLWGVEHKAVVIIASIALLIGSGAAVLSKGFSFLPEMEMEQMMVYMTMPEGSTFEETTEMADTAAKIMASVEGVETVGGVMDDSGSGSLYSTGGDVTFYVILADGAPRPGKVARAINEACAGLDCEIEADASSLMGTFMTAMSGSGVTVRLYGNDLNELQETAYSVAELMSGIEGIAGVESLEEEASGEVHFTVDKEKAAEEGLTVAQVYMEAATALSNSVELMELTDSGNTYTVIVKTAEDSSISPEYIKNLTFTVADRITGEEKEVALADVATVYDSETPSSINRLNQRRYINVTGTVAEGYVVTKVSDALHDALENFEFPEGISVAETGENETIMDAMKQLLELLLVGILLVYLVMVGQFQNLKSPFIVMFTIPLAFTGGFLGIFLTGGELSILSMLGMIMLVGIIVNNGIVLVDYINQLRQGGMERREAIADAAVTRLRPILMTSITTILGLFVMALGRNEATSFIQPLAITCIGGLTYGTLLTLFVVPVMYDSFSRRELWTVSEEDLTDSEL